jgi:quinol monooxygenase YgiN
MGVMIVRMWETRVRPERLDEMVAYVRDEVLPVVGKADGFLAAEVLTSHAAADQRLLLITRWTGEAALESYLGPQWRAHEMTPIPDEAEFVLGIPFADHWVPALDGDD